MPYNDIPSFSRYQLRYLAKPQIGDTVTKVAMALTDTFVRQVKHTGKLSGDKHANGGGMYLLVKGSGRHWRMDYGYAGKRKTLALKVYISAPPLPRQVSA